MICRYDRSVTYRQKLIHTQGVAYVDAVVAAGATPFLVPLGLCETSLRTVYDLADGILLCGGGDIDPTAYGQTPRATLGDVQPERDRVEVLIAKWAATEGKPLLGICRGIQVLAVAAGGTLFQDLPSQAPGAVAHPNDPDADPDESAVVHTVDITPGSRLAAILGDHRVWVNSLHHQAVATVDAAWRIVGVSSDGVIEAIEHPNHPFGLGVQWHPELLTAAHVHARSLFAGFVDACRSESRR